MRAYHPAPYFLIDPATRSVEPIPVDRSDADIPAGSLITCAGGHPITRTTYDLHMGEAIQAEYFAGAFPFQAPIERCAGIRPCICGRPWFERGKIHTADGWKP